jgi:hypothetical protein
MLYGADRGSANLFLITWNDGDKLTFSPLINDYTIITTLVELGNHKMTSQEWQVRDHNTSFKCQNYERNGC